MDIKKELISAINEFLKSNLKAVYTHEIELSPTRKEFDGDFTFVTFPFTKILKDNPKNIAEKLGIYLMNTCDIIEKYNVVNGFLNIIINDKIWIKTLLELDFIPDKRENKNLVLVEFPSPNTNKPLHLGHLRNMFLGDSISNILEYTGNSVKRINLVNDRGIHICKSMLAYKKFGNGTTPEKAKIKGDHFVGKYYVKFEQELKKQKNIYPNLESCPLSIEANEMLQKWEQGDKEIIELWKTMNKWVYEGFDTTFKKLNINFDKTYYESELYLLGKDIVKQGLKNKYLYQKEDSSIWIDLTSEGLDNKLLLRSNGTSVYITQDIGAAYQKYIDFKYNKSIYVVGNEQDYHFNVLFKTLNKLKLEYAQGLYHLSYGMVNLPSGKMKSREGTVVDADNIIKEIIDSAKKQTDELGKIDNQDELNSLSSSIGIGALKYFLLKVDSKKRMLFDPKASIDLKGDTGPFIQYTYARIYTLLTKVGAAKANFGATEANFGATEANFSATEANFGAAKATGAAGVNFGITKLTGEARADSIGARENLLKYLDTFLEGNGMASCLEEITSSIYKDIGDDNVKIHLSTLEKDLISYICCFKDTLHLAAENLAPSYVAQYIFGLAKLYNKMYAETRIIQNDLSSEDNRDVYLQNVRLILSTKIGYLIKLCLSLLRIDAPKRM